MNREYPVHPIAAVGAIVISEDKLLLVRRGFEPSKDMWTVPGGAVELGEKVKDAVIREAKEECGLEIRIEEERPIDVIDTIIVNENGRPQYHYIVLYFLGRRKDGQLRAGGDAKETRWVPFQEVTNYDLTSGFRAFFEKYGSKLRA